MRHFEHDFIMNVHHNVKAPVSKLFHCEDEQITSCCLCDVLNEFPTESFNPLPLLRHTETFIGSILKK